MTLCLGPEAERQASHVRLPIATRCAAALALSQLVYWWQQARHMPNRWIVSLRSDLSG